MSRMLDLMDLSQRCHWSKGVRETRQEEGPMGNLAPPGDREESASHHVTGSQRFPSESRNGADTIGKSVENPPT